MPLGVILLNKRTKRSTIYFEPEIHSALHIKAASTNRSISELVNEAIRNSFREDQEDLTAFEERVNEPTISYERLLEKLKADGKLWASF